MHKFELVIFTSIYEHQAILSVLPLIPTQDVQHHQHDKHMSSCGLYGVCHRHFEELVNSFRF